MEKQPKIWRCGTSPNEADWTFCSKAEICRDSNPNLKYKPETSDPEYLYNWVEKLGMLCEPR